MKNKLKIIGLILSTFMINANAATFDWSSGNYNTSGSPTTINSTSILNVIDSNNTTKVLNRDLNVNGVMNIDASFRFDETSSLNLNSGSKTYINNASITSTGNEFGGIFNEGFLTKSFASVSTLDYVYNSVTSTGKITSLMGELSFLKEATIANNSINLTNGNVSFIGSFNTFSNVALTSSGTGILSFNNYNQYTGMNFSNNTELRAGYHESFSSTVSGYVDVKNVGTELTGTWTIANSGTLKFNSGGTYNLSNAQITNGGTLIVDSNIYISGGTVINNLSGGTLVLNSSIVSTNPNVNYISNGGDLTLNGQLNSIGFNNSTTGKLDIKDSLNLQSDFTNFGVVGSTGGTINAPGNIITNAGIIIIGKQIPITTALSSIVPDFKSGKQEISASFSALVESPEAAPPTVIESLTIIASTFVSTGELEFSFNSDNGTYSQLNVIGITVITGTGSILCVEGCNPADGSYQILSSSNGLVGSFSSFFIDPTFSTLGGKNYAISYTSNGVFFEVNTPAPPPIPEPATGILLLAGLAAVASKARRV